MSHGIMFQRAFTLLSLVGLVGALGTSNATAFGFHGGGHGGGFHGGGGGGNHVSFVHRGGGGGGGHSFHYAPIHTAHFAPPRYRQHSTYYPRVYSRPVIYTAPIDNGPVYAPVAQPVYSARVTPITAPVAAPACGPSGTFISVIFQSSATSAEITGFLKNYNVKMGEGPTVDGSYRVRLSDGPVSAEDMRQVIESMRSQTSVVNSISG